MTKISYLLFLFVTLHTLHATPHASYSKKNPVVDLGSLEIYGELRRPSVEWIDSQRKIKEWLPLLYHMEFTHLEDTLLKPLSLEQLKEELEENHFAPN